MSAAKLVAILEQLNSALQAKSENVSGILEAVKITSDHIKVQMKYSIKYLLQYDLDPLEIPRKPCPPRTYTGQAVQHQPTNPEEHYRKQYFELIDATITGLSDRYGPSKSGLAQYIKLEKMLASGIADVDLISEYPELDRHSLPLQLGMFRQTYKADTLQSAKLAHRSVTPEVRSLFP